MAKAKRATALKAKASDPAATRQKPKGIAKKPVARKPPAARKAPAKPQVSQASKRTSRKAASKKPAAAAAKPEAKKATTKQTGKPASAVRTRAPTKRFVDEQAAAVAKSKKPAARATAKKPAAAKKPVAAAKPVAAKPLAAKPAAAPALRRNTTLQTRGKDQSAGLRPVSRSTGAPVGAKPKPAAQPPVTPTQAKRPAPASVDAVAPARKRARMAAEASTAAASVAHVPKARLSAVAPAVQKARQSSGGASLKAAAGGKADAASPRADKGKSPADVSDSSQASSSGRRQTPGAPASAGAGGASSTGASSKQTALLTDVRMYYNYSRQGSKGVLRFATSGDRRDKKHPWRDDEVQALSDGVATYSKSWAAILRANPQSFHASRTPVDLKDKWRNLQNASKRRRPVMSFGGISTGSSSSAPAPVSGSPSKSSQKPKGKENLLSTHFRSAVQGRKRVAWTAKELDLLKQGVQKYGPKWTDILLAMNGFHVCRTSLDLKDKWRNVQKQQDLADGANSLLHLRFGS